jgi:hypothetical protein
MRNDLVPAREAVSEKGCFPRASVRNLRPPSASDTVPRVPHTIAFPLSRIVDILVPLGCWIFLGEFISALRWWGIALVIIGLALVAKPVAQIEERL